VQCRPAADPATLGHAMLAFLSGGLWSPVWGPMAVFGGGSSTSVAIADGGNGVGAPRLTSERCSAVGVSAVLGGLFC